jgi:hypothetical protein
MPRIFFHSSIDELEALFQEKKDNVKFLRDLEDELRHRTTQRATKLHNQVVAHLQVMRAEPLQGRQANQSPKLPLNEFSQIEKPPQPNPKLMQQSAPLSTSNRPEDILSAWTALEVLSPPTYVRMEDLAGGDKKRVARLNESSFPWERGEKSRPNYRLYYKVVLGSVKIESAVEKPD